MIVFKDNADLVANGMRRNGYQLQILECLEAQHWCSKLLHFSSERRGHKSDPCPLVAMFTIARLVMASVSPSLLSIL